VLKVDTLSYKTKSANKATVKKEWYIVDATNEVLGRLSSKVAKILRGKNKPDFTPHVDCGDNIIIINAEKIRLTGNKLTDKIYIRHTGYPGGQRYETPEEMLRKHPTRIIETAVKGMLPKNKLADAILKNLHIYTGAEHPHQAQQPKELNLNSIK
jgi:large subunit ribosomal protein L13